jgi:hypothetical protein
MKRDSRWWWVGMAGAWLASLAVHPDLVERMIEGDKKAWVSSVCQLLAIVAGYLKASPLDISDKGRQAYEDDYIRWRPLDADD